MISTELLRRFHFLAGIDDELLHEIAMIADEETHEAGSTIFREGDVADRFYLVLNGEVDVGLKVASGARNVVDRTVSREGQTLTRTQPEVWRRAMQPATATTMTGLMIEVVNNGTARCCMALAGGIQAAAKTGTAQLNPKGQPPSSHAWIIGFAPAEAPR